MPRGHAFLRLTQRVRKGASWAQKGIGKGRSPAPSESRERCSPRQRVGHPGRRRAKQPLEPGASLESQRGGEPERSNPPPARGRGAGKVPPRAARACRHLSKVLKGLRGRRAAGGGRGAGQLLCALRPFCPSSRLPCPLPHLAGASSSFLLSYYPAPSALGPHQLGGRPGLCAPHSWVC